MRFRTFFLPVVNLLLFFMAFPTFACGPYYPIIPNLEFFKATAPKTMSDFEKEENLRLWRSLLPKDIPLAAIEQVVYRDSRRTFNELTDYEPHRSNNPMYVYLNNSQDSEIISFLSTAKMIEEKRSEKQSPWYYPRNRTYPNDIDKFYFEIERCQNYRGTRLKDRYALQTVRILFAAHQFERCIEYYDSAFSSIPDSGLMKRMAMRYIAGCWRRLGDATERADSLFALAGDIWSIKREDKVEYMLIHNPAAPQIMEYILTDCVDSKTLGKLVPAALSCLRNKAIVHKGDWAFMLAYFYSKFGHDPDRAAKYIRLALKSTFSRDGLKDLAHAYRLKIDTPTGNPSGMLAELKWLETKCDIMRPDATEWIRRARNILYVNWIPRLWETGDYPTAILLASYADNLADVRQWQQADRNIRWWNWNSDLSMTLDEMRGSEIYANQIDYGSLSFQMMGSLTSSLLATTYTRMMRRNPLYNFLRRNCRVDSDYYNELIGTLALREENYARAVKYLSKVSDGYQRTMNIYKGNYLGSDPFYPYPSRWVPSGYSDNTDWEIHSFRRKEKSFPGAKLDFARKMLGYQQAIKHAPTDDEKGWARIMYAIGRRNSFEECWALTQYWRGSFTGIFEPDLNYHDDSFAQGNYDYLYDYEHQVGHRATEALYQAEIAAGIAMLRSDETRAKVEYLFGNLKSVIRKYPDTATAQFVKTSCDNWKSWL